MNNRIVLLHPPTRASSDIFPLGLAILSAVLRNHDYEVLVIDAAAPMKRITEKETIEKIKEFDPMFVGISLTIDFVTDKYRLIDDIKSAGYPVVAGGPHVNYLPQEPLEHSSVDIICVGEGEDVILEVARHFQGEIPLDQIDGIGFRENGQVHLTQTRKLIEDLSRIPYPDYDDFPIRNYTGSDDPASHRVFWRIMTSRGCPYRCLFCTSNNVYGRKYRMADAKRMFDEIKYMNEKYGAPSIALEDNEPLIDRNRISELCDLLSESDLHVNISCRSRITSFDADLLKKMVSVGFNRISFGIESGDEETLMKINKKYTVATIHEGFKEIAASGFPLINFNNIIGFPWETKKNIDNTIKMNKEVPEEIEYFSTVTTPIPYPGSDLYDLFYDEYGFKEWWLDNIYHEELPSTIERRPFYMNFMRSLISHDMKVDYWHYSQEMKNVISKAKLEIQLLYLRKKVPRLLLWYIVLLCRISVWLDFRSPKLERIIFYPFSRKLIQRLAKRFNFVTY